MQMDSKKYIDEKLDKMFSELGIELKKHMPESIVSLLATISLGGIHP